MRTWTNARKKKGGRGAAEIGIRPRALRPCIIYRAKLDRRYVHFTLTFTVNAYLSVFDRTSSAAPAVKSHLATPRYPRKQAMAIGV